MEKNCGMCRKAGCNTGKPCGHTYDDCCNTAWRYFEPIEKEPAIEGECCNCISHSTQGCKRFSKGECSSNNHMYFKLKDGIMEKPMCGKCREDNAKPKTQCFDCIEYSNFKPIEPKPKPKAEDYEILRDCTLDTLIADRNCWEAVRFYKNSTLSTWKNPIEKLRTFLTAYPTYAEGGLKYLIENKYIKPKERKPEVGDAWEYKNGLLYHFIRPLSTDSPDISPYRTIRINDCFSETWKFDTPNHWKYIGKLKDMIKE